MTPTVHYPAGPPPIRLLRCTGWCGFVELQQRGHRQTTCCGQPMAPTLQVIRTSSQRMVRMPEVEGDDG